MESSMKILVGASSIAFFLLASCTSNADIFFPFATWGWDASEKKVISENYLSLSGIVIGTTTLEDVTTIFGKSKPYKPDSKNYSPDLICYLSNKDDTAVIFQSGPLGGWSVVTAILIGRSQFMDVSKCAVSHLVRREKMIINGISLDSKFSVIQYHIGKPTFHESSFIAYRYQDTAVNNNMLFDISSGLEFELENDEILWFRVYRQLSN